MPFLPLVAIAAVAATPPPDPGVRWALTAEDISALCPSELALARSRVRAALGATGPAAPLERVIAVENAVGALDEALGVASILGSGAEDPAVRRAAGACMETRAAFTVELQSDPALYAAATAAQASAPAAVDRMLAQRWAENARHGGAALEPKARAELTKVLDQLHLVESAYLRTLDEEQAKAAIELSPDEASALPPSFAKTLKKAANGKALVLPVGLHTNELSLKYLRASATRERYHRAFFQIGGPANVERLKQALALRRQAARMLGYKSWAEYKLDITSARTPERALALVKQLDAALLPRARAEIAELAALKEKNGEGRAINTWDYPFYSARFEREAFDVDPDQVRQYFPVDAVVPKLLGLFEQLLGLRFEPAPQLPTWARGVTAYAVRDAASGAVLGWCYLDLAPRDGKVTRPSFGLIRMGRALPGGGRVLPLATVIGNGPAAAAGERALFTHQGVLEMLHELGHLVHGLLSMAPYSTLNGVVGRADFIEAPSQLFEAWAWDPGILRRLSSHVKTGEPMSRELAEKLASVRLLAVGVFWCRQAFIATYDQELNGVEDVKDPTARWMEVWSAMVPIPPITGTVPEASLLPEMGGYDATYYGYLWSRVWAVDIASAFQKAGMADAATGMRYRRTVLEPGATAEPEALVQAFLGRPPRPDALLESIGAKTLPQQAR